MSAGGVVVFISLFYINFQPVPMDEQSEACTIFGCSNTGIMGLNPTQGMDVCPHFSVLCCPDLCVGRGLASGQSPIQGVLLTVRTDS
jgi:hypothetical protein